jgi:hypothetical protein
LIGTDGFVLSGSILFDIIADAFREFRSDGVDGRALLESGVAPPRLQLRIPSEHMLESFPSSEKEKKSSSHSSRMPILSLAQWYCDLPS